MKRFERRKIPGVRGVSKKELRDLSKLPWVVDEALSNASFEARVLPDGRVLHVLRLDGSANLFPTREALAQLVGQAKELEAEVRAGRGVFDPAEELLPPLADFLRDVDKLALGLGKVLRIPDEALDRSVESLDLVDKAVGRMRIAKRMTPEVFTSLTAYLGEVMRLVCDGRWTKWPATIKKRRPVYDPAAYVAYAAAEDKILRAAGAAAQKAAADAVARGAGDRAATDAFYKAQQAVLSTSTTPLVTPLRWEEYEEPVDGHEREPIIRAHDGGPFSPVASLIKSLTERSTYGSLRTAVEGRLARYLSAKRQAAAAGGASST